MDRPCRTHGACYCFYAVCSKRAPEAAGPCTKCCVHGELNMTGVELSRPVKPGGESEDESPHLVPTCHMHPAVRSVH